MNKHKYIVNIIYQQPILNNEAKSIDMTYQADSLGYNDLEHAEESFNKFCEEKFVIVNSPAGKASFRVISVELIDVEEYDIMNNSENVDDIKIV